MSEQTHIPTGRPSGVFTRVAQAIPHLRHAGPAVEISRKKGEPGFIRDGERLPAWASWTLLVLAQAVNDWNDPVWVVELSGAELAKLTNQSPSTVYRALNILIGGGYIDRYEPEDGKTAKTIVHHQIICHRGAMSRESWRTERRKRRHKSDPRGVYLRDRGSISETEGLSQRQSNSPQETEPPYLGDTDQAPYLYMRSIPVQNASPPPPGGGEGGTKGQDSGGLTRREVVEAWNNHSAKPMGVARISDRMAIPEVLFDVPAEMARGAVDAYFEHAPQRTHDWEPLPLSWTKFVKWAEAILQWLADPSLDEPGMGREYSEARRSGRRSPPARPRLALVEPTGTFQGRAPESGWPEWEEVKLQVRALMPRKEFDIWFGQCVPVSPPRDGVLSLVAPNVYARDWIAEHYMEALCDGLSDYVDKVEISVFAQEKHHG